MFMCNKIDQTVALILCMYYKMTNRKQVSKSNINNSIFQQNSCR